MTRNAERRLVAAAIGLVTLIHFGRGDVFARLVEVTDCTGGDAIVEKSRYALTSDIECTGAPDTSYELRSGSTMCSTWTRARRRQAPRRRALRARVLVNVDVDLLRDDTAVAAATVAKKDEEYEQRHQHQDDDRNDCGAATLSALIHGSPPSRGIGFLK